jgi:VPS28 protein
MADVFSIITTLQALEKAYIKDIVDSVEYVIACIGSIYLKSYSHYEIHEKLRKTIGKIRCCLSTNRKWFSSYWRFRSKISRTIYLFVRSFFFSSQENSSSLFFFDYLARLSSRYSTYSGRPTNNCTRWSWQYGQSYCRNCFSTKRLIYRVIS